MRAWWRSDGWVVVYPLAALLVTAAICALCVVAVMVAT